MDTEADFLAQVRDLNAACYQLAALGFETTTDSEYEGMGESNFVSWRRGITNIIVTPDAEFVQAFMAATHVARELNLLRKAERILVFQAVLYRREYWPDPPPEGVATKPAADGEVRDAHSAPNDRTQDHPPGGHSHEG